MEWQEIIESPLLRDLPFKLETNAYGKIVMSPASNRHGLLQMKIGRLLGELLGDGECIAECGIQTSDGVKVADVAWLSSAFLERHGLANPYPQAPEIVVEILSPSNTAAEMLQKKELYFARGAEEFWLCDEQGGLRFFNNYAELEHSDRAPGFPARIMFKPGN